MTNNAAEAAQEELKGMIRKTRAYIIGMVLFSLALILIVIFGHQPVAKFDMKQLNNMEKDRAAIIAQRSALKDLVEAQAATILLLSGKDSAILTRLQVNKLAIDKLKFNEAPTNYNNYGSAELARAFSELER